MIGKRFQFHKQGADVTGAQSVREVIERASIGYEVAKVPVGAQLASGEYRAIKDKWATVRTDNGTPLGVVGGRYAVVQNQDAFGFLDGAIAAGEVKPERAGTFDGGRQAWMLSRFNGSAEPKPGDKVDTHLIAMTGHDGSTSVTVMPLTIRQVCTNGLTICIGNKSLELALRHGQNTQQQIDRFGRVLGQLAGQVNGFFAILHRLAQVSLPETAVQDYFRQVFPSKPRIDDQDGAGILASILDDSRAQAAQELLAADRTHNDKVLAAVLENYQSDQAKGTLWGALNAVTEYTTHQMTTRGGQEGRMQSLLSGQGARINEMALSAAIALAN